MSEDVRLGPLTRASAVDVLLRVARQRIAAGRLDSAADTLRRSIELEVRLIDEKGEQVGVVSRDEALSRAEAAGLDLVEVAPTARPPVCRIMDFGKFKYTQRKKERGTHRASSQLKELRVRPAIATWLRSATPGPSATSGPITQ